MVRQALLNHLILSSLLFALNASAFGQVYDLVKSDYLNGDLYTVATVTKKQLESDGVKGDKLHWSMSLVARANRNIGNYEKALNITYNIPLDSITFEPLYYDIQLLKALLYQESNRYSKADSLYRIWLPEVPDKYSLLLAINYNNYANVRMYYGDVSTALEYYKRSDYYNQFTTDEGKQRRDNLYYTNIANYYLLYDNYKESTRWINKIDTLSLVTNEMKLTYNRMKGKLYLKNHEYENAYAAFIKVRNLSASQGLNDYKDYSVFLAIKSTIMKKQYFNENLIKNIAIFFGFLLYTGYMIYKSKKLNKHLNSEIRVIRTIDKV